MRSESERARVLLACVERLRAGDETARADLIRHSCERLKRLTRKMLHDYKRVHRFVETDDVFQNATIRLVRALQSVQLNSVEHFFGLATTQISRELRDLARHYFGPQGLGTNRISNAGHETGKLPAFEGATSSENPSRMAEWAEFHDQVRRLPDKERSVFGLLHYQGMTQREAAASLKVSVDTVQRLWLSARRKLAGSMNMETPGN